MHELEGDNASDGALFFVLQRAKVLRTHAHTQKYSSPLPLRLRIPHIISSEDPGAVPSVPALLSENMDTS